MPRTLSLLAVLKKVDAKGIKSLSDAQWNTFLASDTEPNEIQAKIGKLEGYEKKYVAYDKTGEVIPEDNNAMIERFKKKTGRSKGRESLKVKKSKIDVASFKKEFLNKKEEPVKPDTTGTSTLTNFKPSTPASRSKGEENTEETEGLKGIRDVLDDILNVLRLDFKGDRNEARDAQKQAAQDKRNKRENKLEGGVKKSLGVIGNAVGAMMKPFSSIWESIINWIKFTLIGVLFQKTLKWFSDPKNKKKAERVGKFFKDWWPALAGAAALFLTPLGALISGMTGLLTAIIPKLVMAIAANPWAAAAVLGGVAIWGVSKRIGGKGEGEGEEGEVGSEEFDTTVAHGGGLIESPPIQNYNEGGLIESPPIQNYNEGGVVQQFKPEKSGGFKMGSFFAGGGLVNYFNEGGEVPGGKKDFDKSHYGKEGYQIGQVNPPTLVVSQEKFEEKIVTKNGEIVDDKSYENFSEMIASIGVPDLMEHQGQLVGEINKVPGYENINIQDVVNKNVNMPLDQYLPILMNSDAQKATFAKWDAAHQADLQLRGITDPSKGFSMGFNAGGEVPGSGNKDTVPAMLTPGEFVMSKGAVQKYGTDTMEGMNAAAGVSAKGGKGDTVPSMLTPGEFVVSAPAVQQYGVKTLESMNLKGGGNNKPELKAPDESVTANKGGLINNFKFDHYSTGGVVQHLQGGGEVSKPQGIMRWFAGAADVMTGGLTDFDQRGSIMDGAKRLVSKEPLETPLSSGENKVVTLPPIRKATQELIPAKSDNDVPNFRIPIISDQRSMVIATLGIQDLVGGV